MTREKKRHGEGLRRGLAERCDAWRRDCRETGVLCDRGRAVIYGCRRILCYAPERILLSVGGEGRISVEGRQLYCTSFGAGAVSVVGEVMLARPVPPVMSTSME